MVISDKFYKTEADIWNSGMLDEYLCPDIIVEEMKDDFPKTHRKALRIEDL